MNLGKPEQRRLITPVSTADVDRLMEPADPPTAEQVSPSETRDQAPVPAGD